MKRAGKEVCNIMMVGATAIGLPGKSLVGGQALATNICMRVFMQELPFSLVLW